MSSWKKSRRGAFLYDQGLKKRAKRVRGPSNAGGEGCFSGNGRGKPWSREESDLGGIEECTRGNESEINHGKLGQRRNVKGGERTVFATQPGPNRGNKTGR